MHPRGRILIVDDEANARTALAELLREEGYSVETAADGFKALPKLDDFAPDLLLTDLRMPGLDGLELMRRARAQDPERVVIVMTAFGAVDSAVAAMREGAADYLSKPLNFEELLLVIERALERRRLRAEADRLRERLSERHRVQSMIGASPAMQKVLNTILQVAPTRATVLVSGESGTGKERIAAALHEHSPRAARPFVKLHCASLSELLLEAELFGAEHGAVPQAIARRDGRLQQADGGTLYLDEVSEVPPAVQVKLLRFLRDHEFERVGGDQPIKVDVRVVAATHRDLLQLTREGRFREDLYYRLNVVSIDVPPLRERPMDIPLLATHFLRRFARENGREISGCCQEALERLLRYSWPGNVRELENALERAVVVCRGDTIRPEDFGPGLAGDVRGRDEAPPIPGATLSDIERYAILKTLEHTGGSTSRAAEILGISTRKIQYKLHEYEDAGRGKAARGGAATLK